MVKKPISQFVNVERFVSIPYASWSVINRNIAISLIKN